MIINEIFSSIDGEAKRAGELATFIRTVGCNLRCSYCDSKYTWGHEDTNKEMTVSELVEECKKLGNKNITFTGGEPLLQKDADELINALADSGFEVSIETDGAIDFTTRDWFINNKSNIWVCADYKCYESGQTDKMLPLEKFAKLRPQDVLKFVVGSEEDLNLAYNVIDTLRNKYSCNCYVYLSPVFGKIEPKRIVEFMQEKNMQGKIKFQFQIHKLLWDPNRRAV